MDTYLRCKVGLGQFTGEVVVQGLARDGEEFSLFVPEEFVDYDNAPIGDTVVDGWIRIGILDADAGLVLVRLPGQTFENGYTITVTECQVELRTPRELA